MRSRPPCPLPRQEAVRRRRALKKEDPPPPMTPEEALAEAGRCLSLNDCQGCEICELICPDQAVTKDSDTHQPVIDLRFCKGCGLCAHLCPKGAIAMVPEGVESPGGSVK